jgi:hypothetical protein
MSRRVPERLTEAEWQFISSYRRCTPWHQTFLYNLAHQFAGEAPRRRREPPAKAWPANVVPFPSRRSPPGEDQ